MPWQAQAWTSEATSIFRSASSVHHVGSMDHSPLNNIAYRLLLLTQIEGFGHGFGPQHSNVVGIEASLTDV